MAAAILVLMLVAGGLTAIFRNQGRGQPGGIGAAATPTIADSLPMTVTVNGISVTVQVVDSTGEATRFYVNVTLPPSDPGYGGVLGQSPAADVQIDGMNAQASDLHVTDNGNGATQSNAALWLDYPAPFPTNRTVTLTIKQLWFPQEPASPAASPTDLAHYTPTPLHMQAVTGPGCFTSRQRWSMSSHSRHHSRATEIVLMSERSQRRTWTATTASRRP